MTSVELQVGRAWQRAAHELGFCVAAPAVIETCAGGFLSVPVFIHAFGSTAGTIVLVLDEPSERLLPLIPEHYYCSRVAPNYQTYDRDRIVETLNDWEYYGSAEAKPAWYTGLVISIVAQKGC